MHFAIREKDDRSELHQITANEAPTEFVLIFMYSKKSENFNRSVNITQIPIYCFTNASFTESVDAILRVIIIFFIRRHFFFICWITLPTDLKYWDLLKMVCRQIGKKCLSVFQGCTFASLKIFTMPFCPIYKHNYMVVLNIIVSNCWSQNGHLQMLSNIGKLWYLTIDSTMPIFSDHRSENFQLVKIIQQIKKVSPYNRSITWQGYICC